MTSSCWGVHEAMVKLLPGMTFKGIDRERRDLMFDTVDGEVPPDVAQKVDVVELVQPVRIVGHDGVGRHERVALDRTDHRVPR